MSVTSSPRAVGCPPPPLGCSANPGEPCSSHGGTRVRHGYHQARTAVWETARIAAVPAAKLIADAVAAKTIRSGKQAAALLTEHGHHAEADRIQQAVRRRSGLMSAKQAVLFLVDTEGGGGR